MKETVPGITTGEFVSNSPDETLDYGQQLGSRLVGGEILLLSGPLGAGKTLFVKGICAALGIAEDEVTSPSFTLVNTYSGSLQLYHIDLYRLDELRELASLGLDEIFDRDALVLIEWGERFPQILPEKRTEIRIRAVGDDEREIQVTSLP